MPFIVACALFLFLGGEETRGRKAARGETSPSGVPADCKSAGTPDGLEFLLNA